MRTQPGSGCGRIDKEDVMDGIFLLQAKSTRTKKITINLEDLRKLKIHAAEINRDPAFAIGFVLNGMFGDNRIWIMEPLEKWSSKR